MNNCVETLQDNLCALRILCGWTMEDLAKQLGLSRQTVVSIEKGNSRMSKTQYLAVSFLVITGFDTNSYPVKFMKLVASGSDMAYVIGEQIEQTSSFYNRNSGMKAVSEMTIKQIQEDLDAAFEDL